MTPNLLNVSGLTFDLLGAALLVSALVFEKGLILKAQSLTIINGNPALHLALVRQQQDARFGLLLLVIGLGQQALAAFGVFAELRFWYLPITILAVLLAVYAFQRNRLNKSELAQRATRMIEKNARHINSK